VTGEAGEATEHAQWFYPGVEAHRISDEELRRLEARAKEELNKTLAAAPRGSKLHKLALALSLLDMLTSHRLGSDRDQTLEEFDRGARDVLGMRRSELQAMVERLLADPEVTRSFTQAKARAMGGNPVGLAQGHANYILSDEFSSTLPADPHQRAEIVGTEFKKLLVLDPDVAKQTSTSFMALEISRDPGRIIANAGLQDRVDAIERVLLVMSQLDDEASLAQGVVYDVKNANRAVRLSVTVKTLLQDARSRSAIAKALGSSMAFAEYYAVKNDQVRATQLLASLEQRGENKAAAFITKLGSSSGGGYGRGLAFFTGLVGLATVVVTFPPVDAQGRVRWADLGWSANYLVSFGAGLPTYAKLINQDLRAVACWVVRKEVTTVATTGAKVASTAAQASKFIRICKVLGPVGDAIALPVIGYELYKESKNEDNVAMVCRGVQMGSCVLGLLGFAIAAGSTGIGIPLALVALAAGLGASLVRVLWGESATTGRIRQDLRYLGITDAEDKIHAEIAQRASDPVYVAAGRFGALGGGYGAYTPGRDLAPSEVRTNVRGTSIDKKVALINHYMDQATSGAEENLIYNILNDTPRQRGEFLRLIEALDTKVLASELEDDTKAAQVMGWILAAYTQSGTDPVKFGSYLERLAYEHRDTAINRFFDRLGAADKRTYHKVEPATIRKTTENLMDGYTNSGEERALYRVLETTSSTQFHQVVVDGGGRSYTQRLRSELSSWKWKILETLMQQPAGRA
jgi:hypothetical protein